MKKRLLLVLPVLSLLASCGSDPLDAVRQSLPEDVEQKADPEDVRTYADDALVGAVNIAEERMVYHLSIDMAASGSGSMEGVTFLGSTRVKGDLLMGVETVYDNEQHPYSSAFINLVDFSLATDLNLPPELEEYMPFLDDFQLEDVNLYAYFQETSKGTIAYLDLSDHTIQDYFKEIYLANGGDSAKAEEFLDSLLGTKEVGAEYRPGLVEVDVTEILTQIDSSSTDPEHVPLDEDLVKQPLSYFLKAGSEYLSSNEFKSDIHEIFTEIVEFLNPIVGAKYEELEGGLYLLDKTSVAINVSSGQIADLIGVPESYLPVHGVAGLVFSVGLENGSNEVALQDLKLSANISFVNEVVSLAFSGVLELECAYNDLASMLVPEAEELVLFHETTDVVFELLTRIL